ncbi:MAG: L,D-transpeptidase family protein [Chthoniobacteraceae bacterium]|nr:L,D-transpeptidase family protein [Chthoniobacteraceae bacterium]
MKPLPCLAALTFLAAGAFAQQPGPSVEEGFVPAPTPAAPGAQASPTPAPLLGPVVPPTEPVRAAEGDIPVAKAVPVGERELAVQVQIFLDQKNFGPGKIDGRPKEFTLKALERYEKANGLPSTGALQDAAKLPLGTVNPIYATYTITPDDLKYVGDVPHGPAEQAKLKKLLYPSLLIFVAERYHSDPDFLAKINRGKNLEALQPGDTLFVPNVAPFKIETVREIGKLPAVPEFKTRQLHIDTKEKMLDLVEGNKLIASFPITPGSEAHPAPAGTWKILGIATLPWFRHDEGVLSHGVRTDHFFNLPSGPSNPVGVLWCGLNRPGIGVHGTNSPFTIGRAGSHGCIRLANWDAIRLATMITEGMTVIIENGVPAVPATAPQGAPAPARAAATPLPQQARSSGEKKDSSTVSLTAASVPATKNAPQVPGRETNYANH